MLNLLEDLESLREFRRSERCQRQAAISWGMDSTAFMGDSPFIPREDFVDNRYLSPPERIAVFVDDTRQVASLIPQIRQGVQSQVDVLPAGAVEAWELRNAYREAVNNVAAQLGARHAAAQGGAECVGRALGGARRAYQDQLSSFSPIQGLKDRARMFNAEGSAQAVEEFREDQERKDSFAAESGKVVQSVSERVRPDQAMAEDAGRSLDSARFAFQEYGFESFDDYLKDSGAGLGRFLDVVDTSSQAI